MKNYEITVELLMCDKRTLFCERTYGIMARSPEEAAAVVCNNLAMDYEHFFRIVGIKEVNKNG